jgi:hypothetical protein
LDGGQNLTNEQQDENENTRNHVQDVCSNCGCEVQPFTKTVSRTSKGAIILFLEVPASRCSCEEYTNLLDGVKMDLYIRGLNEASSHHIRFEDIDISDEEIGELLRRTNSIVESSNEN